MVSSAHGSVRMRLHLDNRLLRGTIGIPHGFEAANVNLLTTNGSEIDALTGMPAFFAVEVRVEGVAPTPKSPVCVRA